MSGSTATTEANAGRHVQDKVDERWTRELTLLEATDDASVVLS